MLLIHALVPLQIITYVQREVPTGFHIFVDQRVCPVHHARPAQLLEVEVLALSDDFIAKRC
jgi:hypothetical protein